MNRIIVKPVTRWFSKRQQWTFELRASNGARIDPRDSLYNRDEQIQILRDFFAEEPVELIIQDRYGNVQSGEMLR